MYGKTRITRDMCAGKMHPWETHYIIIIIIIITSSGDLQPSTAIANQLPGHLVSTQI